MYEILLYRLFVPLVLCDDLSLVGKAGKIRLTKTNDVCDMFNQSVTQHRGIDYAKNDRWISCRRVDFYRELSADLYLSGGAYPPPPPHNLKKKNKKMNE